MKLQQENHELVKEKEILRTCIDSLPNRETHSTMTSPSFMAPGVDPVTGMSLKVITYFYIFRLSFE
jgi:hypothetical protein